MEVAGALIIAVMLLLNNFEVRYPSGVLFTAGFISMGLGFALYGVSFAKRRT